MPLDSQHAQRGRSDDEEDYGETCPVTSGTKAKVISLLDSLTFIEKAVLTSTLRAELHKFLRRHRKHRSDSALRSYVFRVFNTPPPFGAWDNGEDKASPKRRIWCAGRYRPLVEAAIMMEVLLEYELEEEEVKM